MLHFIDQDALDTENILVSSNNLWESEKLKAAKRLTRFLSNVLILSILSCALGHGPALRLRWMIVWLGWRRIMLHQFGADEDQLTR